MNPTETRPPTSCWFNTRFTILLFVCHVHVTYLGLLNGKLDSRFGVQIRFGCADLAEFLDERSHLFL